MNTAALPCDIDIVIVVLVGGETLAACLQRLMPWHDRCHVVLAAENDIAAWQARFPQVRFLAGEGQPVPLRRQRGVLAAQAAFVALLEDTTLPEPGWLEAACDAFANERIAAVAGPVSVAPNLSGRFQALACTEYGRYHATLFPRLGLGETSGEMQIVSRLPGNHLAYRRALLLEILAGGTRGLIEGEINEVLKSRGQRLAYQPRMAACYAAADRHGANLGTRMQHGRLYASQRAAGQGGVARLVLFAKALLLPVVLSVRGLNSMLRVVKPAAWPGTALWIVLMESAWAWGEALGSIAGPGRSMEAWR